MSKIYTTKSSTGAVLKDIDSKAGIITGYAASFDTLDSDGDVFTKGAFKKSISENSSRIMHLLQHDILKPIGRPTSLIEDNTGLLFEEKLTPKQLEVGYIRDTLKLYEAGVYNEHSVGFITMQDHKGQKDSQNVNYITEAKLMEYSTVTFGANENTPLVGIKSLKKEDATNRIDVICKALRIGDLSDDTYIKLEIELQQIKTLIETLQPSTKGTAGADEPLNEVELFLKAIKI
jgi:hypothetical protein